MRTSRWLPEYESAPRDWGAHPRKKMLMTPWLVLLGGGVYAFLVPTIVAAFFQLLFFNPSVSDNWSPLTASAVGGREIYVSNGCVYCHSGFSRPQDVREGLYYLYPEVSLPGDSASSDQSPNVFGTARIGPDLSHESGFHPDDWQRAHFSDARYVDPLSIMPRFSFLTDKQVEDLIRYVQTSAGKSGLVRYAGEVYMKRGNLLANGLTEKDLPTGLQGQRLTMAEVADKYSVNAPEPPSATVDGLPFPDVVNLNIVDRSYWLVDNPMPITTENLLEGRRIFQERCIGCHGQGGAGTGQAARFLRPTPADFTSADDQANGSDASPGAFYYRVLRGIEGTAMENFGTRLRVDEIWKVVLFLKTIPNGSLQADHIPTPDMYIQWKPGTDIMGYVAKHPIQENKRFLDQDQPTVDTDPFLLEAKRDWAGLNANDSFVEPGLGEVSLKAAARDIKVIYDQLLASGWDDYVARGGTPVPPASQKAILPDSTGQNR